MRRGHFCWVVVVVVVVYSPYGRRGSQAEMEDKKNLDDVV
jgi:hypothetical protein